MRGTNNPIRIYEIFNIFLICFSFIPVWIWLKPNRIWASCCEGNKTFPWFIVMRLWRGFGGCDQYLAAIYSKNLSKKRCTVAMTVLIAQQDESVWQRLALSSTDQIVSVAFGFLRKKFIECQNIACLFLFELRMKKRAHNKGRAQKLSKATENRGNNLNLRYLSKTYRNKWFHSTSLGAHVCCSTVFACKMHLFLKAVSVSWNEENRRENSF